MPEPLTAALLVTLATQEFIKSGAGDLAKRFTTEAIAKIPVLWQKIKTRLKGRSDKVNEALVKVEEGDSKAIETITKNLDVIFDEDPAFAQELKILAQTIQAGKIQDNSSMTQNISDHAKGWQVKAEGGINYIGDITIHRGQQPEKKT
jgi:hypothetical protein